MSEKAITTKSNQLDAQTVERVLLKGDLSTLSDNQKLSYYKNVCDSVGLNPLTKPFDYIPLNGKLVLYATKSATDQLRTRDKVSIFKVESKTVEGVHIVTAYARLPDGREDASTGAVSIANLKGDALANALMKAETKAKRRVTLSICGLGMLDESELETIADVKPIQEPNQIQVNSQAQSMMDRGGREKVTEENVAQKFDEIDAVLGGPEYVFDFGQFKGRSISSIPADRLVKYYDWLKENAKDDRARVAVAAVSHYLSHSNGAQQ